MRGISFATAVHGIRILRSRPFNPPAIYPFILRGFKTDYEAIPMTQSSDITEVNLGLKRGLDGEEATKSPKTSKRKKKSDPLFGQISRDISMAAKANDCNKAMEQFRYALSLGYRLSQGQMNSVLYLLVGGDTWIDIAKAVCQPDAVPSEAVQKRAEFRDEVLSYMKTEGLMTDEMVYTAQARLAACVGDPDSALDFARQMVQLKAAPKLRLFTPALIGFSERGEVNKAMEVIKMVDECGLDLTELEFQLVLSACCRREDSYEEFALVLGRVGLELTYLQRDTVEIVRGYFKSALAKCAFKGEMNEKKMWFVEDVAVDAEGYSMEAGEKLGAVDLSEEDWSSFITAFEKLVISKSRKENEIPVFIDWIGRNGPFEVIVDGANVAFHKQNFDHGRFRYSQIDSVMKLLESKFPEKKILLVLSVGRTRGKSARSMESQELISNLRNRNRIFETPSGSNDDWYWLYAALKAKERGLLVSNDECRDHIFQLLAPKYFLKWKERHLARFDIEGGQPVLKMPSAYTSCTQQLSNGTWMLPYRDDEGTERWLCAKPL